MLSGCGRRRQRKTEVEELAASGNGPGTTSCFTRLWPDHVAVSLLALSQPSGELLWGVTVAIWVVGERILTFRDLRSGAWRSRQDRGSYFVVVAGVVSGFGVALLLAFREVLILPAPIVWLVIGLVIAWAGLLLRLWAVVALGRSFTTTVLVRSDQRVVTTGPYRLVRHPSYLGLLVLFFGLGLALGDVASVAALVVLPAIGLVRRIAVEEAALQAGLGDAYGEYARGRARLIPGVW
jgi:protein-S-isoprenylcysteine O-methyltransferase Ste14